MRRKPRGTTDLTTDLMAPKRLAEVRLLSLVAYAQLTFLTAQASGGPPQKKSAVGSFGGKQPRQFGGKQPRQTGGKKPRSSGG